MSPLPPLRPRPRPFGLGWYWTGWGALVLALFLGFMAFSFAADAIAGPSSQPASAAAAVAAPLGAADLAGQADTAVRALQHRQWALAVFSILVVLAWVLRHVVARRVAWLRGRVAAALLVSLPIIFAETAAGLQAGLQFDPYVLTFQVIGALTALWPSGGTTNGPPPGPDPSQPQPRSAAAPTSK